MRAGQGVQGRLLRPDRRDRDHGVRLGRPVVPHLAAVPVHVGGLHRAPHTGELNQPHPELRGRLRRRLRGHGTLFSAVVIFTTLATLYFIIVFSAVLWLSFKI